MRSRSSRMKRRRTRREDVNSPEKSEMKKMKLIRVLGRQGPAELEYYIVGRSEVPTTREYDMRVVMDPEPISFDALDTRLRNMKLKTIKTGENIRCARTLLAETYAGGSINILMRELSTLEGLLDSALRHAESVADQIKRQTA